MRTVCIGSVFVSDLVVGCHEEDHASEQQAQVGRLVHPAGTHLHLGGRAAEVRGRVGVLAQE